MDNISSTLLITGISCFIKRDALTDKRKMRNISSINENSSHSPENVGDESFLYISEDAYEQFTFISNVIKPIVCVFGMIGNILGLSVLWKDTKQQRLPIYAYLCSLTFFDTIYLILGLIRTVPLVMELYDVHLAHYVGQHMRPGTIYLDMLFTHTSTAILVVMSMERFNAVVRPFSVKSSYLSRFTWQTVCVCFLVNVTFLLPFPINFEVISFQTTDNATDYFLQFRNGTAKDMDIYMVVQTVVDFFIPACLLLVSNIGIPIALARTTKTRSSAIAASRQMKVTSTVIIITLLYLLLAVPNIFIKTMAFIDDEYSFDGKKKLMFWLFIEISNLFTYVNAANDWIIYVLVSNHYRQVFKDVYCRCCALDQTAISWTSDAIEPAQVGKTTNSASTNERY